MPSAGEDVAVEGDWWAIDVSPVSIAAYALQDEERATPLIEIVGWRLVPDQGVSTRGQSGEVLALDLCARLLDETDAYYLPWVRLGETTYRFTTAGRFNTPWWQPGEIVVERFELPVPWLREPASGPSEDLLELSVGIVEVSRGRDLRVVSSEDPTQSGALVPLTSIPVTLRYRDLGPALGNLRGEILLRGARIDGQRVEVGGESLDLQPGQRMRVVLEWESLRPIEENYKVFVQLLDVGLQVRAQGDDKAPLGGSAPTLLWFPRWRDGTRIADTYLLDVPPDLAPGTYPLIVGMYGFSTFQRLPVVSYSGGAVTVQGDWITLAHMQVE
jgi:hypothetical protein